MAASGPVIKSVQELNNLKKPDVIKYAVNLGATLAELNKQLLDPVVGLVPRLRAQIDQLDEQLKLSQHINLTLVKQLGKCERVGTENAQYARRETVEFHGIDSSLGEGDTLENNIINLVNGLVTPETDDDSSSSNVPFTSMDFHAIHRLYKKDRVIVKFTNRKSAREVLSKKLKLKEQTFKDKHKLTGKVFLNESMCPAIKHLFYACKQLKAANKLSYYSFYGGSLRVKLTEQGEKKTIFHKDDLAALLMISIEEIDTIVNN